MGRLLLSIGTICSWVGGSAVPDVSGNKTTSKLMQETFPLPKCILKFRGISCIVRFAFRIKSNCLAHRGIKSFISSHLSISSLSPDSQFSRHAMAVLTVHHSLALLSQPSWYLVLLLARTTSSLFAQFLKRLFYLCF